MKEEKQKKDKKQGVLWRWKCILHSMRAAFPPASYSANVFKPPMAPALHGAFNWRKAFYFQDANSQACCWLLAFSGMPLYVFI